MNPQEQMALLKQFNEACSEIVLLREENALLSNDRWEVAKENADLILKNGTFRKQNTVGTEALVSMAAHLDELREQNTKLQAAIERVRYQISWFEEAYDENAAILNSAVVKAFSVAVGPTWIDTAESEA